MTTFAIIRICSDARAETTVVAGYSAETIMLDERKRMESDRKVIAYHIFRDGDLYISWSRS